MILSVCVSKIKHRDTELCILYNQKKILLLEIIIHSLLKIVKTHISSLRQKMVGADAEYIKNIWGVGYKFEKV